jgi:hypothetical protein
MARLHPPGKSTRIAATCSAAEILYLVEKNRLPASAYDKLRQARKRGSPPASSKR